MKLHVPTRNIFLIYFSNRKFVFNEKRSPRSSSLYSSIHQIVMSGNVYSEGGPTNGQDSNKNKTTFSTTCMRRVRLYIITHISTKSVILIVVSQYTRSVDQKLNTCSLTNCRNQPSLAWIFQPKPNIPLTYIKIKTQRNIIA